MFVIWSKVQVLPITESFGNRSETTGDLSNVDGGAQTEENLVNARPDSHLNADILLLSAVGVVNF